MTEAEFSFSLKSFDVLSQALSCIPFYDFLRFNICSVISEKMQDLYRCERCSNVYRSACPRRTAFVALNTLLAKH